MVSVKNLSVSFTQKLILDKVSFTIGKKERTGLLGRNGSGKTTLCKILTGELTPDEGEISFPRDYSVRYVEQDPLFSENSVLEEGVKGLPEQKKGEFWEVEKILSGLGFSPLDMQNHPSMLSGGFQVRLNLAKGLLSEPDLLILDEPTNYLDIVTIRWLSGFLKTWKKELILITHDRGFMDSVITHCMIIHRKKIKKIKGTTGKLYQQLFKEEEIYEKTITNLERKQKEVETFINRFRAKARLAGLVQSRLKMLAKTPLPRRMEKDPELDFSFTYKPTEARYLIHIKGLSFSYSEKIPFLIKNLNFSIARNDCIGVIGKNGRGKTTLLRLLYGELKPTMGIIKSHPSLASGYFGQSGTDKLVSWRTVEEELQSVCPLAPRKMIMGVAGVMLFSGEETKKKISVLSGGERSRVLLGKILLTPSNLLLLDEPTNHLDMESSEALVDAVNEFPGAVVLVTHNENLLNQTARRLIVFQDQGITIFEGTYQEFLETVGWVDEKSIPSSNSSYVKKEKEKSVLSKKELRTIKSKLIGERSKKLNPVEKKIPELEKRIESLEKKLKQVHTSIISASRKGDGVLIQKLSVESHHMKIEIEKLYEMLEKTFKEKEKIIKEFEARLQNLT